MKITRETLLAMQQGIPTKELEIIKELSKKDIDKNKIKESYEKSSAVSTEDLDVSKVASFNKNKPKEVSTDAIIGLLSGKKPKDILAEGNAFVEEDNSINSLLKEGVKVNSVANEHKEPTLIKKDEIKEMIYEIFGEILGVSNDKAKDENYIKKTLSEVYTFIKLKETLK